MMAISVALSFMPMDTAALFRNCAVVQAFPVAAGVVLSSVLTEQFDPLYTRYGPFFAWFVLMALVTGSSCPRAEVLRGERADDARRVTPRSQVLAGQKIRRAGAWRSRA
jgi:hypothetical protein